MSKRAQHLCLMLASQVGCVAVGLWMQRQFLQSAAFSAAVDQAWVELDAEIGPVALSIDDPAISAEAPLDSAQGRLSGLLREHNSRMAGLVAVDGQWRVVATSPDPQGTTAIAAIGHELRWTPSTKPSAWAGSGSRGSLTAASATFVAVAVPLKVFGGYLVAYRSREAIEARTAMLLASLPAISGLTFAWTCALLGISAYMILARFHDEAQRERTRSISEGLRQRQELIRTRDAIVFGLAKLADSRDTDTGDHLERISVYSTTLATALRRHPQYRDEVSGSFVRLIGISSALHDIGKVGIEDRVLLKPAALTAEERKEMQEHTTIGAECLREIEYRLGNSNFLQMAREIANAHHERWDGKGYPHGMQGTEIPLAARIVAIADVYDALASRRVYKEAFAHDACVATIRDAAGTQFDPTLVEVWLGVTSKFADIARRYTSSDTSSDPSEEAAGRDAPKKKDQEASSGDAVARPLVSSTMSSE